MMVLKVALLLCLLISSGIPVYAQDKEQNIIDPKQRTVFVFDIDGTLFLNIGCFRLKRAKQIESAMFPNISGLPEEICVPVQDYEGNVGPRIGSKLMHGRRDENGKFIIGMGQDEVTLSDGQKIVPAFYYLDPEFSYEEFRTRTKDPKKGPMYKAVAEALETKGKFLLESYAYFAAVFSRQFENHLVGAGLTMRGHEPEELKATLELIRDELKLGKRDWKLNASVNLTNPKFLEFNESKKDYLSKLYYDLSERMMNNHKTPHFLVMFENSRKHIKDLSELFEKLSNTGVGSQRVIPILVNAVEPEVFANPNPKSWDDSPLIQTEKMSRVSVFWPNRIERTDDMLRVFELSLGMSLRDASSFVIKSMEKNPHACTNWMIGVEQSARRKIFAEPGRDQK
ncbi:MAG: hypothetical protein KA715_07820 [Xanthomonadaceae bacterium]|nr:hypothetical protein [Xanthomonadaceae bacterium]